MISDDVYFPTQLQKFQFYDKYSRFNYELGRRENWFETVSRSIEYLKTLSAGRLTDNDYNRIKENILKMNVAPSMRLLAMAGPAADVQNIRIYNCSYLPIDSLEAIVEPLIISMNGCGVGYSVENQYISKLPKVKKQRSKDRQVYIVNDSSDGWAYALALGLERWFDGFDVTFDYSQLRPAGAPLITKGGQSSGPKALMLMMENIRDIILNAQNRKLSSLEVHDIVCHIGSCAVSGGSRRTAMISLFDFDDKLMRHCKDNDFDIDNDQRWNANNSAIIPEDISYEEYNSHMSAMFAGERGEPGLFSRANGEKNKPERRKSAIWGSNPCSEILLRPNQFCNLSVCIAREDDTISSLKEKVELASIIGTIQSCATYFPGLRNIWKQNAEEERLLGVDITGQRDCDILNNPIIFSELKSVAIETNKKYANILGINQSASVTCVKPSGNSSQLFNCSSGIHGRWSEYYIRNVRVSAHSPLFNILKDHDVPMDPENGQTPENAITWVIHFPIKSPSHATIASDLSAIEQLEYWKMVKLNWAEHNVSNTISYNSDEINYIIQWVWENKDIIGGLTFLPKTDAKYNQMPYQSITKSEYELLNSKFPIIDFSGISRYEITDQTRAAQEIACSSGQCEII